MSYYGILPLGIPNQPTMNHYGCSAQLSLPKPVGTPCTFEMKGFHHFTHFLEGFANGRFLVETQACLEGEQRQ